MKRLATLFLAVFALASPLAAKERCVDFRYAMPWWQTAICLPDDPDKALVGKDGQLLFDWSVPPFVFRGFQTALQPEIVGTANVKWVRQETLSAKAPIVRTWKDAGGVEVLEETFVVAPKAGTSEAPANLARRFVVLVTLKNTTGVEATRQPALRIIGKLPVQFSEKDGTVTVGKTNRIAAADIKTVEIKPKADSAMVLLAPLTLAPGESRQVAWTIDRHCDKPAPAASSAEAAGLRDAARQWWETSNLPFDTVQIPDPGIQGMIESCVRNIWQAREMKKGKPAFHVGPTCYRGLWIVDGSFLLESAAILNRAQDARAGIEYMLSHQKPDGSFEVMRYYWKENGIVLWAATRHAMLTQDKEWLRRQWPNLQRVVAAMQNLRAKASKDPKALNYGLLPGGMIDGGISNYKELDPEFSNTHWCLTGLKAAVAAAHWLGNESDAAAWQKEYDDFYAAFRKAATRDTLKDKFGNAYVPTMMNNVGKWSPQKGQWDFCHAVYPGQIFEAGDPMAEGQMAMLRATKVEGMVFDTGWMADGIWNYFASFYGHAVLWMGHGDEAAQVLYDFANHAVPTRVWREEQKPVGKGVEEVGDMPHNWASAEFIRLAVHLLELDRGDELHLLEGMPGQWLKTGMTTRLNGVATPFGPLTMTVQVDQAGKTATLTVKPLADNCKAIVVHLPGGAIRNLPPTQGGTVSFDVP